MRIFGNNLLSDLDSVLKRSNSNDGLEIGMSSQYILGSGVIVSEPCITRHVKEVGIKSLP